jgi:UDP-N-acetylmuramyl tripeptide synthase
MKTITILICKMLSFVGKLMGKGSSLPGMIALKLCPNILQKLQLPKDIIAITGSNGKTSTVEMVAGILKAAGKNVVYNKEGSNQIEGVTTMLLNSATLSGKVKGDIVLLESDERYARHTFKHIKPTMFAITNLYRDQLTRNAHPYHIYDIIKDAVELAPRAKLVLNADDPIVRNFGYQRENVVYFGMDKNGFSTENTDALYNDCHYCPRCKGEMHYDFFHYTHLGSYHCPSCGYARPETEFTVRSMDLQSGTININGDVISLEFASKYNVYNICAAYTAASLLGIPGSVSAKELSDFVMKNGRVVRFTAGDNEGLLITSKHENSTSYNQSLSYVAMQPEKSTLVILVDAISRKYYTAETSWLWDISFELLEGSNVKKIILTGKYAYDLAVRFELANITTAEIIVEPDLDKMGQLIREPADKLFAVTCFSDKEKLFARVQVQTPTAK